MKIFLKWFLISQCSNIIICLFPHNLKFSANVSLFSHREQRERLRIFHNSIKYIFRLHYSCMLTCPTNPYLSDYGEQLDEFKYNSQKLLGKFPCVILHYSSLFAGWVLLVLFSHFSSIFSFCRENNLCPIHQRRSMKSTSRSFVPNRQPFLQIF